MILTKIDQLDLSDLGIEAYLTQRSRPMERETRRRQRSDASAYVGSSLRPGEWDVNIPHIPDNAARDALISALDANMGEFRLRGLRAEDELEADAALRRIDLSYMANSARLTFEPTYPTWRGLEPVTSSGTLTSDGAVAVTVPGNTSVSPVVRLTPTLQRSTESAAVGWKWRTRYRITNNGDETLYRYPVRISLGDTEEIVSEDRALSNGNDVRVWAEGKEVARTLLGWDSAASYVWVIVSVLRPGRSADFDVMWGNTDAGTPPSLTYPDRPAFDMANSTNARWRYQVTAGNGAYYLSSGSAPPLIDMDVPGAWHATTTLPDPDNADDAAQYPYHESGGDYSGPFKAVRGITGGLTLPNEGLADGLTLHHPLGITSVSAVISYQNDLPPGNATTPLGKFVILTRASGSQGWAKLFERATAQNLTPATINRTTYTSAETVKNIAFAVWPQNEIEVDEKVKLGQKIEARWSDYCDVNIDSTQLGISEVQGETEVYEVAATLRVEPGDERTTAFDLRLGTAASTGPLDHPRLACELGQVLVIDGRSRTAAIWNEDLTEKVEDVPNFALRAIRTAPVLGEDTETPTHLWLPLKPASASLKVSEDHMGTLDVAVDVTGEWVP